jgi:hypothetical protein
MPFSVTKRAMAAAVPILAAALIHLACEGPDAGGPQAARQGGARPPDHGSGMVVRCGVCRGAGSVAGPNGSRMECRNCEGLGKVRHTK